MNKEKLESAKRLFFIALGLDIAVTAVVVLSDFWSLGVLKDIGAGRITPDESMLSTMEFWDAFAKLMILTLLGVGLGLVKWLNTCYSYAKESLGASGFKNEGWTTFGWIIPILNLFKPYQVINEIYKAGSPTYTEPDGWKKEGGSGLLLAWWIFWAVTHLIGALIGKEMFKRAMRDDMTLQQSIGAIEFHAWFCVVFLVVSGLWFVVAGSLTRRLLARQNAGLASPILGQRANESTPVAGQTPIQSHITPFSNEGLRVVPAEKVQMITEEPSVNAIDEQFWAEALREVDGPERRDGLWARSFAQAKGDETQAKAAYLEVRARQLAKVHETQLVEQERVRRLQEQEERLAGLTEEERAYELLPKGVCPNCEAVQPLDSEECPSCKASFGSFSAWKLIPLPNH